MGAAPVSPAWVSAGAEHWHGGTDTPLMADIAMPVGDADGDGATWLEPVTDEQYTDALNSTKENRPAPTPTAAVGGTPGGGAQ